MRKALTLLIILLASALTGALAVWFAGSVLWIYGLVLFLGFPLILGFGAVLFYEWRLGSGAFGERSLIAAIVAVAGCATGLLTSGVEGAVCILMAAPLALPIAALGGFLAHVLHTRFGEGHPVLPLLILFLAAPVLMGAEAAVAPEPELFRVTTAVEVDAPPETVWRHVVSFSELPPPKEWLFRTGIAYPMRAEIRGRGVGAVRYCVFSTGAFVEPIEVWDEPRQLQFSVADNPAPMEEWSPRGSIHPPHLDGFLMSEKGRFDLEELPGGRTRLVGTTWYRHGLFPSGYWRLWSDGILHRIHLRVLDHVKRLSEGDRGRSL
ncbi:MAG: SRPBCC family protein [Acidobacteriota bacterium]